MKKTVFFFALLLTAAAGHSQVFKLVDKKGAAFASGHKFTFDSYPDSTLEYEMYIKNNSAATVSIAVQRFDDALNKNQGDDTAYAYFCTGIVCLTPEQTSNSISLDQDSSISFKNYFKEASTKGYSAVRYKFISGNETQEFTFIYNLSMGVPEQKASSLVSIYPNPAANTVIIDTRASVFPASIVVRDIRGAALATYSTVNGTTELDVSGYDAGLYFVTISGPDGTVTRKLQVSR